MNTTTIHTFTYTTIVFFIRTMNYVIYIYLYIYIISHVSWFSRWTSHWDGKVSPVRKMMEKNMVLEAELKHSNLNTEVCFIELKMPSFFGVCCNWFKLCVPCCFLFVSLCCVPVSSGCTIMKSTATPLLRTSRACRGLWIFHVSFAKERCD